MIQGLDYAGGRPTGAALKAAGYQFVVRYLSDGGPSLPGKLLLPSEADDLRANGVDIVSNWETTADRMLAGYDAGAYDAQLALKQVLACGGRRDRPIYFSADFDAAPQQQSPIDDYLRGAASVLGTANVGIYGGFWPISRALTNGTATWAWQTVAWSGSNRDDRINLMQRNDLGYAYIDGVPCDINEAHTVDYGQWSYQGEDVTVPTPASSNPTAVPKPADEPTQESQEWDQLLIRWEMLGGHTIVEALAVIGQTLGIPGFTPPS